MKKQLLYILLAGLALPSCKDFLEEKPLSIITAENFYNTQTDLTQGINAAYSSINYQWREPLHIYSELRADYITVGPEANDASKLLPFENFTYNTLNSTVKDSWGAFYKTIDDANILIEKAPRATADEAFKQRVVAEAYFLRAYAHYCLVRLWGAVPLKKESTKNLADITPSKNSVDEVYELIIADLKLAAGETAENQGLPDTYTGADLGRVTKGAAQTLLAEVLLTRKDWSGAAEYAKKVMNSKLYALWPKYADAFAFDNKYKKNTAPNGEAIFEAQFNHDVDPGIVITRWCAPRNVSIGAVNRAGFGNYVATAEAYASFAAEDARKQYIFPASYQDKNGKTVTWNQKPPYYMLKYNLAGQPTAVFGNSANNWPILRYADVLLIYAEAVNEQSGPTPDAYLAINAVRKRAGLPDLADLTSDSFREAVYRERGLEFFLEGRRFFDLVRTGRFVPVMSKIVPGVTETTQFLPIPQSEMDLNPNLQ